MQEIADKIVKRDKKSLEAEIMAITSRMLALESVMDPQWDILTRTYNSQCLQLCFLTGEISRANFDLF